MREKMVLFLTACAAVSINIFAAPEPINPGEGFQNVKLGELPPGWQNGRGSTWSVRLDEILPAEGTTAALRDMPIDPAKEQQVHLPRALFSSLKGGSVSYRGKKFGDFSLVYQMKHATERDYWNNELRFRVSDNNRDYYMVKRERYGTFSLYRSGVKAPLAISTGVLQLPQEKWLWVKLVAEGKHIQLLASTDGVHYEPYIDYTDQRPDALKEGYLTFAGPRRFKFGFAQNPWNDDAALKANGAWITRAESGSEIRQNAGSDKAIYTAKLEIFVADKSKMPKTLTMDQDGHKSQIDLKHLTGEFNTLILPIAIANDRAKTELKFTIGNQTAPLTLDNTLNFKPAEKSNLKEVKATDFTTPITKQTYNDTLTKILDHYGYFGGRFSWDVRFVCLYALYQQTGDKKYLDGVMLWVRDWIKQRETGKIQYLDMGFPWRPGFAYCSELAFAKGDLNDREKEAMKALISNTLAYNFLEGGGMMNRALGYALMPEKLLKIVPDHPMREQLMRYPAVIKRDLLATQEVLENSSNYLPLTAFYVIQFIDNNNMQDLYQSPGIKNFAELLLELVDPSGAIPQFADYGGKRMYAPMIAAVLERFATVYKDGRFKWAARQMMRNYLQNFDVKNENGHNAYGLAFAALWADDSIPEKRPDHGSVLLRRNIGHLEKMVLRSSMKPEAFNVLVDFINGGEHGDNMALSVVGVCNDGGQSLLDKAGRDVGNHSVPLIRENRNDFPYLQKNWNFGRWNNSSFDLELFWSWGNFPGGASSKMPTVALGFDSMIPGKFTYDPAKEFAFVYLFSGSGKAHVYFDNIRLVKDGDTPDKPKKVKLLEDFESDAYGWMGNFKQVPGGVNGKQCGRFLIDFAESPFIGKVFPFPLYVYGKEYDRIEFDFKIEPISGTFDRWCVMHLGDDTGTTRNYPSMHMQNYRTKQEFFQENPRSTFAAFRLDDKGETGKVRSTRREFMFAKDHFLWVRDSFKPSVGEPFAVGPVWQIGELTGKKGDNWYDTQIDTNLLFYFPRKPYGTLEMISNPTPNNFEAGYKKQYPALLTYCVDGSAPKQEYVFDTIMLPHDGKGDANKLADSIKVLYDKDFVTLIAVGDRWMLRNPEGKPFEYGDLKTSAKLLYLERKDGKIVTSEELTQAKDVRK